MIGAMPYRHRKYQVMLLMQFHVQHTHSNIFHQWSLPLLNAFVEQLNGEAARMNFFYRRSLRFGDADICQQIESLLVRVSISTHHFVVNVSEENMPYPHFLDLRLFNSPDLRRLGLCYCCQAWTLETVLGGNTALTRWWTAKSIDADAKR